MKRNVLALTLGVALAVTFMPIGAMAEEVVQTEASAPVQAVPQPAAPQPAAPATEAPAAEAPTAAPATEAPAEVPATEVPAEATAEPFQAKVRIALENKGAIYFGDKVTLRAVVEKANAKYTVVWEYYNEKADVKHGENPWVAIEKGEKLKFTVNEENVGLTYRAVVNGMVASKTYKLSGVTAKPVEDEEEIVEPEEEITEPEVEEETETDPEEETADPEEEVTEPEDEEETETEPEEEPTEPEVEEETEDEEETEVGEETQGEVAEEPELDPNRSIAIHAEWEGEELYFGDESTLVAELSGYDNAVYTVQWQTSQDNENWTDVEGANELTYTMIVTEENWQNFWRLIVNVTGVKVEEA